MQFIEFHRIYPQLHTNGRFDGSRLSVFESDQLDSYPFHLIQHIFGKLFQ